MVSTVRRGLLVLICGLALVGAPFAHAGSRDHADAEPWAPMSACVTGADTADASAPVPPAGVAACPEVRPGDGVYSEFGTASSSCVAGFMYRDRRGDTYLLTGADCAPPYNFDATITTWPVGKGPVAREGRGDRRIGEWAFRFAKDGLQLSMIRLDRGIRANPQMCQYGGPTGENIDLTTDPEQLVMVGDEGGAIPGVGSVLRPGIAQDGLYDYEVVQVTAESLVEYGMPVVTADGQMVGISDWYSVSQSGAAGFTFGMTVVRPGRPIAAAERALRTTFTLLTAPLL